MGRRWTCQKGTTLHGRRGLDRRKTSHRTRASRIQRKTKHAILALWPELRRNPMWIPSARVAVRTKEPKQS
eukprot:11585629-Prorocentrum_lima.AAC.1